MPENLKLWSRVRTRPVVLTTASTENAPPWAVLEVVNTAVINRQVCIEVQQPAVAETRRVMFNTRQVLKTQSNNNGRRHIGDGTIDFPCQVLCESNVVALDTLKVKASQWDLAKVTDPDSQHRSSFFYCMGTGGVVGTRLIDAQQEPPMARWIEYTLHATGGDLESGDSTHLVTVVEYHDGSDPGTTVTVHFEEKWEGNVGNVGKAFLGSDGNYHNLVIDCLT